MAQAFLQNRVDDSFLNPKQEAFLHNYLDPKSETFSNVSQSGIKAGYDEGYAAQLVMRMPTWLEDAIGDAKRMRLAENNLHDLMEQNDDVKVKADMTKFALSTMGRRKYSTRTETDVTSKGESISQINYIVPTPVEELPADEDKITDVTDNTPATPDAA